MADACVYAPKHHDALQKMQNKLGNTLVWRVGMMQTPPGRSADAYLCLSLGAQKLAREFHVSVLQKYAAAKRAYSKTLAKLLAGYADSPVVRPWRDVRAVCTTSFEGERGAKSH